MSIMNGVPGVSAGRSSVELDQIDYRILAVLRDNGRVSISALAQDVGISRSSAYHRVEALIDSGVITGFTAEVDPMRLGMGICALVFCSIDPDSWHSVPQNLAELPEVESLMVTTGEHDLMLTVRGADVHAIQSLVVGVIAPMSGVRRVETVLVLDETARRPYVLPTDVPERPGLNPTEGLMRFTRTNPDRPRLRG